MVQADIAVGHAVVHLIDSVLVPGDKKTFGEKKAAKKHAPKHAPKKHVPKHEPAPKHH